MKVVVLTSFTRGLASVCLPSLAKEPSIEIAMIVYSEGRIARPGKLLKRKFEKVGKVGLLGMLNGLRMNAWYQSEVDKLLQTEDLWSFAKRLGVRVERTPTINCPRSVDLFKEADADLGLSLGNSYIGRRVFSIPKHGMVNIHLEVLPAFQGAQSIIWQIYHGSLETGYTIHQIDSHIDTGDVLFQEKLAIKLKPSLRETVSYNTARLSEASAKGLVEVVKNYPQYAAKATPQQQGSTYTTPSFRQYLRIVRQYRKLMQAQESD